MRDRTEGAPKDESEREASRISTSTSPKAATFQRRAGDSPFREETPALAAPVALGYPQEFGRYRILSELGRGATGVVYRARQTELRREVALKVIRRHLAAQDVRQRFEREATILGRIQHPGVAGIFEAGTATAEDGEVLPYFAMELVEGSPIDGFLDRVAASQAQRLSLFAKVCDAVEAAHKQGIVHRDLKPGNILVVPCEDGVGQPKVLDFGLARVLNPDPELSRLRTRPGEIMGTLGYMSPEQLLGGSAQVDFRADVYALGALLFQLLAGRLPFDFRNQTIPQVIRRIQEGTPARLGELDPSLRGDLEVIVDTALQRDPKRRYQSAAALADDVRRHLHQHPIKARPPSWLYRTIKFAERHRVLVAACSATIASLVLGLALALNAYLRAASEQRSKETALEVSNAVVRFLSDTLLTASPRVQGRDITVREALGVAEKRIERDFAGRPAVAARLHHTLGSALFDLGELEKAKTQLQKAVALYPASDAGRQTYLLARMELAELSLYLGDAAAAAERCTTLVAELREAPGSMDTLVSALTIWSRAALNQFEYDLSTRLITEAEALLTRQTLPNEAARINVKSQQATLASRKHQWAEAVSRFSQLHDDSVAHLGEHHPTTLAILGNLAGAYAGLRRYDDALRLTEESLELHGRILGPSHRATLANVARKTVILASLGRGQEALRAIESGLRVAQTTYPEDAKNLLFLDYAHGKALSALGRDAEAISILNTTLSRLKKEGQVEGRYFTSLALLEALTQAGRTQQLNEVAPKIHEWLAKTAGSEHPRTRQVRAYLGAPSKSALNR